MIPDPSDVAKSHQTNNTSRTAFAATASHSKNLSQRPAFSSVSKNLTLYQKTVKNLKASALSIIADSKEVEVLILKTNILNYLPEQEKDKIYEDLAKVCDPDKPSSLSEIMKIKAENKKWEGFRAKLVNDIKKSR